MNFSQLIKKQPHNHSFILYKKPKTGSLTPAKCELCKKMYYLEAKEKPALTEEKK